MHNAKQSQIAAAIVLQILYGWPTIAKPTKEIDTMKKIFSGFVAAASITAITGILYWVCFAPSFYTFAMSFSEF